MSVKNDVTNQKLGDRFDNNFNLVNYAILLAKKMVGRGEGVEQNVANSVLDMIVDYRDDEDVEDEFDDEIVDIEETNVV